MSLLDNSNNIGWRTDAYKLNVLIILFQKYSNGVDEIVHLVKVLAAKSDSLPSVSGTHVVGREN